MRRAAIPARPRAWRGRAAGARRTWRPHPTAACAASHRARRRGRSWRARPRRPPRRRRRATARSGRIPVPRAARGRRPTLRGTGGPRWRRPRAGSPRGAAGGAAAAGAGRAGLAGGIPPRRARRSWNSRGAPAPAPARFSAGQPGAEGGAPAAPAGQPGAAARAAHDATTLPAGPPRRAGRRADPGPCRTAGTWPRRPAAVRGRRAPRASTRPAIPRFPTRAAPGASRTSARNGSAPIRGIDARGTAPEKPRLASGTSPRAGPPAPPRGWRATRERRPRRPPPSRRPAGPRGGGGAGPAGVARGDPGRRQGRRVRPASRRRPGAGGRPGAALEDQHAGRAPRGAGRDAPDGDVPARDRRRRIGEAAREEWQPARDWSYGPSRQAAPYSRRPPRAIQYIYCAAGRPAWPASW